jgi:glutamate racemase
MLKKDIDYLVLGCSHYPYLIPQIQKILPNQVTIIDSGIAVANQTKNVLIHNNLLSKTYQEPKLDFYTNTDTSTLEFLLNENLNKVSITIKSF